MRPHHRTAGLLLALVAIVFGVFFNTLEAGFLRWDDDINVFENPHVQGLTAANLRWMFTDFEQAIRYKPLSWLAWAIVHEGFGLNPFGYHLANVLLHCANAVLVFLLLRRLLQFSAATRPAQPAASHSQFAPDSFAALGALLWAVHPLRVEPVAWVTGLPYGLSLLFLLLATLSYLRAHSPELAAPQQRQAYWMSVGMFALAVLAYPIVLGFVAALLALDLFPLRRWNSLADLRRMIWEKLPFLALSLLLVAGTVYGRFNHTGDWVKPVGVTEFGLGDRLMQSFYLWAYYVWKAVVPADLGPFYTSLLGTNFFTSIFWVSSFFVVGVTLWLLSARLRRPAALALWLAHLGLLVPMLGLTERPHYPHDRYSILDGVLVGAAITALLWHSRGKSWHRIALGATALLVGWCAVASFRQTRVWENDFVFFEALLRRVPRTGPMRAVALLKLGNAHADAGEDAKAEACYQEATQLSPDTTFMQLPFNYGNVLSRLGRWPEATTEYCRALKLAPHHLGVLNNYGIALTKQGQFEKAYAQFAEALRIKPNSVETLLNYGVALLAQGNAAGAIEHLLRAVELQPNSAESHAQLAEAFTKQGKPELAREHAAAAERLQAQPKP